MVMGTVEDAVAVPVRARVETINVSLCLRYITYKEYNIYTVYIDSSSTMVYIYIYSRRVFLDTGHDLPVSLVVSVTYSRVLPCPFFFVGTHPHLTAYYHRSTSQRYIIPAVPPSACLQLTKPAATYTATLSPLASSAHLYTVQCKHSTTI